MSTVQVPICAPEESGSSLLEAWFELWLEASSATLGEFARALTRGPRTPLELARWLELVAVRDKPAWSTPHRVVWEGPLARLRDFSSPQPADVVSTLVLPPQAGHDSCIVDYSTDQSQMRTILEAGLERAFALDWVGATASTAHATIEDYIAVVDRAVQHAGGRVNLVGDCQGGWLATVYAALYPERVNTLTIAGAPIDFHAGQAVIHEVLDDLTPGGSLAFYKALVASGGGVLKGEHMLRGFILINPLDEYSRQLELLRNIDDAEHVARYREFEDWFKHTQDIPGAFYLWIVEHLFRDNALISGTLEVGGRAVDLAAIDMPLALLAGASDHITPPAQVFALAEAASTQPQAVRYELASGGHLGLFMGHEALAEKWPSLLSAVAAHSQP